MLVVRGRFENRQAIVKIGLQRFLPTLSAPGFAHESLAIPIDAYEALIDTGAQRTCLTHHVIAEQKLTRHGKKFIQNVHSEAVHSLFFANIGFFSNGTDSDSEDRQSYYALPTPVEVINFADNDRFDAIIGMDVLGKFDFQFDRTGQFELRVG